jgi:hypothetical protein
VICCHTLYDKLSGVAMTARTTKKSVDAEARINARFPAEDLRLLKELQVKTRQSTSTVLREAVRRYHATELKPRRSAYEIMKKSGFIGGFEGPEDLSSNTRKYMEEALREKYPQHFEE